MNRKLLFFLASLLSLILLLAGCGEKEPYETFERESRKPRASTEETPAASASVDPGTSTESPQPSATEPAATEAPQPSETEPAATEGPQPSETDPAAPTLESAVWGDGMDYKQYDEQGRLTEFTRVRGDGKVYMHNTYEYFPGTTTPSAETYDEYDPNGNFWYGRDDTYYPDGSTKTTLGRDNDGTSNLTVYDEAGRVTSYTSYYANGQKRNETVTEFHGETSVRARETSDSWAENGALTYHNESTFREDGSRITDDTTYDDGYRLYREYNALGLRTLEEEYYANGQRESHIVWEYDAEGRQTARQDEHWNEDGSLSTRGEYTYWPDGVLKTERYVPNWDTDKEEYYEYDELGRYVYEEWKYFSKDDHGNAVREYWSDTDTTRRITVSSWDSDGLEVSVSEYDEQGRETERSFTEPDGSTILYRYNEAGRDCYEERRDGNGLLTYLLEAEYYPDSYVQSHRREQSWREDENAYYIVESWNNENGTNIRSDQYWPDGTHSYSESNNNGNTILSEHWYANGQMYNHAEYEYYSETGPKKRSAETQWDEEGNLTYLYEETFYEETGWTHTFYSENDGYGYYREYDAAGNEVLYEENHNGTVTYRRERVYNAEGVETSSSYGMWSDDGAFVQGGETTYYPNGITRTNRTLYDDGSTRYYEQNEDGETLLDETTNPAGIVDYRWTRNADGSSSQYERYPDGALSCHYEWAEDGTRLLYDTFAPEGWRYRYERLFPDGTQDNRTYDGEGRIYYQDLYTPTHYYDRRFSEGRMYLERREKKASDGGYTYLGSTEYSYFEEGGVKKIRIYENNELGVQISSKVVNDDGKIGYIDPPQEWTP